MRALGDPFLHPADQPLQARDEIAGRFGEPRSPTRVFAAPPGAWSGPVSSSYGVHLVLVHEREAPRALAFDEVRDAVRHAVLAERRRAALERGLRELRAQRARRRSSHAYSSRFARSRARSASSTPSASRR